MNPMPTHDWQFWTVTIAAAAALGFLARGLMPRRWRRGRGVAKVTLTVRGRK